MTTVGGIAQGGQLNVGIAQRIAVVVAILLELGSCDVLEAR